MATWNPHNEILVKQADLDALNKRAADAEAKLVVANATVATLTAEIAALKKPVAPAKVAPVVATK